MRNKPLTAAFVKNVRTPGRYGDGHGGHGLTLDVKVSRNGRIAKSWIQRIRMNGKPTHMGLGAWPVISLATARDKAIENARALTLGRDPRDGTTQIPTFAKASEIVIGIHAEGWKDGGKSENQWRSSLRDYVLPTIGHKRVDDITTADVMGALVPHWTSKHETMRRVKQRVSAVMRWSMAQGFRQDDPAGDALNVALPKRGNPRQHLKALPYHEVSAALDAVNQSSSGPVTKLVFHFLVLTAARSGEVRGATWDEMDLDNATWTVPAERMKSRREHRVPLSEWALQVLGEAEKPSGNNGLIFPSPTGRQLPDSNLSKMLRRSGIESTAHGFRSSFRQWAAERTNTPREVCEMALAHVNSNAVEAAYQRSDLFDLRRKLMEAWATYLAVKRGEVRAIR